MFPENWKSLDLSRISPLNDNGQYPHSQEPFSERHSKPVEYPFYLIISFHQYLGLPSGLFYADFLTTYVTISHLSISSGSILFSLM
jgi:hypothetical protein